MLSALTVIVMLSAPPTQAQCVDAWPKSANPTKELTQGCIDLLLKTAYGPKVDAEALTLDPDYGHPIEVELSSAELGAIGKHIAAVCPKSDEEDWRCTRAAEYVGGMRERKTSLFENLAVGDFARSLQRVVDGEELDRDDLCPGTETCWSALTLWKLRNAAYARHGYKFDKDDLNRFFYDPRPGGIGRTEHEDVRQNLLPLPRGLSKDVKLTPVDSKNVKLIKEYEAKELRRAK